VNVWYQWRQTLPSIVFGVGLIVFGGFTRMLSLRSRDWPVAPGRITHSYLSTKYDRTAGRTTSKSATIRYQYTAGGQTYEASTVSFGQMFLVDERARVERYPEGSAVDVHYDPAHPDVAVLEPGAGPGPGLCILAGLALLGYGAWKGLR
jgi:uncharacterized protein DUF3592